MTQSGLVLSTMLASATFSFSFYRSLVVSGQKALGSDRTALVKPTSFTLFLPGNAPTISLCLDR